MGAAILEVKPAPFAGIGTKLLPSVAGFLLFSCPPESLSPPCSVCFHFHLPSLFTAGV